MAISILDLPNEILLDIVHYLPQSFITSIEPLPPALRGGLSSICRVNKLFNALATPLLYEHIHLDYDALWEGCLILHALVGSNVAVPLQNHSGSKFIREVTIYEKGVDPYRDNYDWAANIHRCIGEFLRQIGDNQLTSLSILTTDYDVYSELFSNQKNLRTLKLNCCFPDRHLDKKIGIDRDSFKRYREYRGLKDWRTWMSQLDPPINQSRNFYSLSFEWVQICMDIITITHLELMPTPVDSLTRAIKLTISSSSGFSADPRGWNVNVSDDLPKRRSQAKHFASTLISCMNSKPSLKELTLSLTDIVRDKDPVSETQDQAQEGRTVFDIIFSNFSPVDVALEKLTLNSFDEENFTAFPSRFLVNVTELNIHPYRQYERYMDDFIANLPCSLRKLHVTVITDKNVSRRALLRHRDTLEVLCLANLLYIHPSAAHIVFSKDDTPRDDAPIDWETLTSDEFPKLRELGAHLAPGVLQEGRVEPLQRPFQGSLYSICLANKQLNQIALPLLYEHVHIEYEALSKHSRILDCLIGRIDVFGLSQKHPGFKFIRDISISDIEFSAETPLLRSNWEKAAQEPIIKFLRQIDENQLHHLLSDDKRSRNNDCYISNLSPQTQLRSLKKTLDRYRLKTLNMRNHKTAVRKFPLNDKFRHDASKQAWLDQIGEDITQAKDLDLLSLQDTEISLYTMIVKRFDLTRKSKTSSTRFLSLVLELDVQSIWCWQQGRYVIQPEKAPFAIHKSAELISEFLCLLASYTDSKFCLRELSLRWIARLNKSDITSIFNLIVSRFSTKRAALQKLTLDTENSSIPFSVFPSQYLSQLTELCLSSSGYGYSTEYMHAIETLPQSLRVLRIESVIGRTYINRRAILRHKETLEVLWLRHGFYNDTSIIRLPSGCVGNEIESSDGENGSENHTNEAYEDDDRQVDWATLISDQFPKLREVAVPLAPELLRAGLVGENFRIVRILNGLDPDYRKPSGLQSYVTEVFHNIFKVRRKPNIKAIAFGSPDERDYFPVVSYMIGADVYFPNPKTRSRRSMVMRCTRMTPRQTRYLLPDVSIIGENERPLGIKDTLENEEPAVLNLAHEYTS
ncbi:hypothetical protein H072_10500 [Dactylellina haptotyla CBS 200.50]|uniref:Uncharacterized protein n=1 Tax=Dactylellina haptotyla (strain CBS 200.50) TaxID=1284197 RepID=S8BAB7_DACHA|nr:hypothetical protein H072_10500 [Dactylellina haptotyla CBS 200.50]